MMALEGPVRSLTGNLPFTFDHHHNMTDATDNDHREGSPFRPFSSPPPVTDSALLRPNSVQRIPSNSMHIMSPSDIVGPSPVTSNGTETTEIEDDVSEEVVRRTVAEDAINRQSELVLSTDLPDNIRQSGEEAVSVIHAPQSFTNWRAGDTTQRRSSTSPKSSEDGSSRGHHDQPADLPTRPLVSTNVKPVRYSLESATPQAQDLQDMIREASSRLRSSSTSSLEKIDEQTEGEGEDDEEDEDYVARKSSVPGQGDEVTAVRVTLEKCWTLCQSLAEMSSVHRRKVFNSSGTPDAHEKAWRTCWKLCQRLYDDQRQETAELDVRLNLDLCRDFCQALFDVRSRGEEVTDSILRVSFELNNHLFSTQNNRVLPEAFQERTLDFYVTLCHRLMRQRSELAEETDQLLRSCWSLAEMLFSLRQNRLEGQALDVELLSSAVQACWDLADIFRDGWTQVRPERSTPRPNQTSFFSSPYMDSSGRESRTSNRSSYSKRDRESVKSLKQEDRQRKQNMPVPETPVTEFEDTPISPGSRSPQMPNIMVLGTTSESSRNGRWSSNASNLSGYSQSSTRTSSTATTTAATEDPNITKAKVLVLRAAMNMGFDRDAVKDAKSGPVSLQRFVQNLPSGALGNLPHQMTLLQQFKNSVLTDAFIPRKQTLPMRGRRVLAHDMAKSVAALTKSSPRYGYLRELYRCVFQFPLEEADSQRTTSIVV